MNLLANRKLAFISKMTAVFFILYLLTSCFASHDEESFFDIDITTEPYVEPEIRPVTLITGLSLVAVVGEPRAIGGRVFPADATNGEITWSVVSGSAVIEDGILTASAEGAVAVKATVKDGLAVGADYTQIINIKVVAAEIRPVTGITGVPSNAILLERIALGGVAEPADATYREIIWEAWEMRTGAGFVDGNFLWPISLGEMTVVAVIRNGVAAGVDYRQFFKIIITAGP